jgi:hypothetical protein
MSENEAVSPKSLALLVKSLPLEDGGKAAAFLEEPDIVDVYSASTSTFPAKHWLDIYRVKFGKPDKSSVVYGADALIKELDKLSPQDPVTLCAYEANGQLGLFWLTGENTLVGFAIIVPKI